VRCHLHDRLEEDAGVGLETVPTARLKQADDTGVLELLRGLLGQPAELLGLVCLISQVRLDLCDPVKNVAGIHGANLQGSRPPRSPTRRGTTGLVARYASDGPPT